MLPGSQCQQLPGNRVKVVQNPSVYGKILLIPLKIYMQ